MASSTIYFFNIFLLSRKGVRKTVGLLRKFQNVLPKTSKLLLRPHLHHDVIIHDQAYNFVSHQKLEPFQYNAFLVITCTISGSSREKLHRELGLEFASTKEMVQRALLLC